MDPQTEQVMIAPGAENAKTGTPLRDRLREILWIASLVSGLSIVGVVLAVILVNP